MIFARKRLNWLYLCIYTKLVRFAKMTKITKQNCYMCVVIICIILISLYGNYFDYSVKHIFNSALKRIISNELIVHDYGHEGTETFSQLTNGYHETFSNEFKTNMSKFSNTKLVRKGENYNTQAKWININISKEQVNIKSKMCTLKNATLSRVSLPITGLVSFPGSGNTWVRHLIQQMTGKQNIFIP